DEEADRLAVSKRRDPARTVDLPGRRDLLQRVGRRLESCGQQRLHGAVPAVTLRDQARCVLEVLVGKWVNLELRHRRRTIALGRCRRPSQARSYSSTTGRARTPGCCASTDT